MNYSNYRGVIHVGANLGQERDLYAAHNLDVLWFEPNPSVFKQLQKNIAGFPKQEAHQFLITDKDDETYVFNISSHKTDPGQIGQSSSIFDLNKHKDVWPDVYYSEKVEVKSITLDTFMKRENKNLNGFQKLHVDTQGADLLVMKGAIETLRYIKCVQVEVSSMELYKGGCFEKDIFGFLKSQGFELTSRGTFIDTPEGSCSENIYEKL